MNAGNFDQSDIAAITPFIEQMGSGQTASGSNYRKEFWWEREWRKVGDFTIPNHCIGLCPESEIAGFKAHVQGSALHNTSFVDPNWSLEQIIAHLAGIPSTSIDLF
jgi:hypothetical protein